MIEVEHLTKSYGSHLAVLDLNFSVKKGEILGFLGPNGAGKSTTMNILTGYLSATAGKVTVNGYDVLNDPNGAKASIGYLPELPPLYMDMTVSEYLNFMFDLKKCKLPRQKHLAEICHLVKIEDVYDRLIKNLSKGYRQRVGFAQALIGNPPVLVLDEPTVGLDPKQIVEIRSLIKSLGKHHTIILSSHILSEIEAVCDRLIIINHGVIVADGTAKELSSQNTKDPTLTIHVAGADKKIRDVLNSISDIKSITSLGEKEPGVFSYTLRVKDGKDVRRVLFEKLAEKNLPLLNSYSNETTLEDLFIALTQEDATEVRHHLFEKEGDEK